MSGDICWEQTFEHVERPAVKPNRPAPRRRNRYAATLALYIIVSVVAVLATVFIVGYADEFNENTLRNRGTAIEAALSQIIAEETAKGADINWNNATGASFVTGEGGQSIAQAVSERTGKTINPEDLMRISTHNGALDTFAYQHDGYSIYYDGTPAQGLQPYTVIPAPVLPVTSHANQTGAAK